ncbi:MAG: ribosome small subunit-dependent GTPase A [Armatimonadetes bacterium]|nr:ribosome small subunit-dependent GTPase A [Armatimonadota bacterium]
MNPATGIADTDPALPFGCAAGLLVASGRGGTWEVELDGQRLRCRLRDSVRDDFDPLGRLVVGDRVVVRPGSEPGRGAIEARLPRRSQVGRGRGEKAPTLIAANIDQLVIVLSARMPEFTLHTLDRYLTIAAAAEVEPLVVLNKSDLDDGTVQAEVEAVYPALGYRILRTSVTAGLGIESFAAALAGCISAVVGPSGAGKSSLLNAIDPSYRLRIGQVMAMGKGRHTTTGSRLLRLDCGGWVADTPGIKTLGLVETDLEPMALQHLFPELDALFGTCRFANCTHRSEPDCAVSRGVAAGRIAPSRHASYQRLFDELEAARRR